MERLTEIMKRVNPDLLETDKRIMTDALVDSVDLVGIVAEIEEVFGIEIPIEDISPENFDSVDLMWSMIERLQ